MFETRDHQDLSDEELWGKDVVTGPESGPGPLGPSPPPDIDLDRRIEEIAVDDLLDEIGFFYPF